MNPTVWLLIVYSAIAGSGDLTKQPTDAYDTEAYCKAAGKTATATKQIGADEIFTCLPVPMHRLPIHQPRQ
jgi:hypothetical protein